MISNKIKEEVLLYRCCKENSTDEQAVLHLECLQDMLKLQAMENLFRNSARTKKGTLRKDSLLWNRLNDRLDLLVREEIEFGIIEKETENVA